MDIERAITDINGLAKQYASHASELMFNEACKTATEDTANIGVPQSEISEFLQVQLKVLKNVKQAYYDAMVDAYLTGCGETLRVITGENTPLPWSESDENQEHLLNGLNKLIAEVFR